MIKKILSIALILSLISFPAFGAWDKNKPAGSDLISDIDTLVIANNTALELTASGLQGWLNLKVVRTSATVVTVTADQLYLKASATIAMRATSVSEAIDITASGASGLDTGAEGNKWYYIYIIAKADGTVNGLLSASATSPTLPAGYIYYALVSAVHNTAGDFVDFIQSGKDYAYTGGLTIASGNVGTAWVSIDLTEFVPSSISTNCYGSIGEGSSAITNNSSVADGYTTSAPNKFNSGHRNSAWFLDVLTANTIYWNSSSAADIIYLHGFEINKIS